MLCIPSQFLLDYQALVVGVLLGLQGALYLQHTDLFAPWGGVGLIALVVHQHLVVAIAYQSISSLVLASRYWATVLVLGIYVHAESCRWTCYPLADLVLLRSHAGLSHSGIQSSSIAQWQGTES